MHLAKQYGAEEVYVVFVHPVLSANAVERLASLPVKQFITTNTIPIPARKSSLDDRLTILSIGPGLAR